MAPVKPAKIWLFRCFAVLAGLGLVVVVELLLSLVPGLGQAPLLVTRAEDGGRLLRAVNGLYSQRFFAQQKGRLAAAGKMAERFFVEPSAPQTYRVVFLGASTVQGFPHPRRLAAPAFLEVMLADALPGREVEVFNLGITSIASFAVAQVAADAMELKPDLVVVYSGHNEFYGIFGAGDQLVPGSKGLDYGVRQLNLFRLADGFVGLFNGGGSGHADLLQLMGRRGAVALDSPRRPAAARQLRQNLERIVQLCKRAQVPLVLCTLASNVAGFAPVGSAPVDLAPQEATRWTAQVEAGARRLTGDYVAPAAAEKALDSLSAAARLSADHAWLSYLQGRALARLGRDQEAAQAFRLARDLDTMPWRAPSTHNEVIRALARQEKKTVALADVEAVFDSAAPPAGVGWGLMVDHVHFSVAGQALMARTVLKSIGEVAAAAGGPSPDLGLLQSTEVYRRRLGDLPVERTLVSRKMAEMLAVAPMDRYNGHNVRYLKQLAAMEYQRLSAAEQRGVTAWAKGQDGQVSLALTVADLLFESGDFSRAEAYYRAARLETPYTARGDLWAAVQWAWSIRRQGKDFTVAEQRQMRAALQRAGMLAAAVEAPLIDFVKGHLYHLLDEHQPALTHLERAFAAADFRRRYLVSLFHPLAAELVRAGREQEARRYAREAAEGEAQVRQLLQVVDSYTGGGPARR